MARRHDGGELRRDVEARGVAYPHGGGVLAGENRARVDGLALGVDERVGLCEGLGWEEPLECRGGGGGGVGDEEGGVIGEGDGEL